MPRANAGKGSTGLRSVFFYKPSSRAAFSNPPAQGWQWWFKVWAPVVVAVAVICVESTNTFSAKNTSGWLRPMFQHWFGAFDDTTWERLHHYLRKSGHFVGYGTVGLTYLRAWLHTLGRRGLMSVLSWRLEASILTILSTAIVATADEIHQAFLPDRTGTPVDVLLDTSGACVLCLLVWLICWTRQTPAFDEAAAGDSLPVRTRRITE